MFARGRQPRRVPGTMNGLERDFSLQLEARKREGEIVEWWFESFTFKLAPDLRYSPDFCALMAGTHEVEFFEVKGGFAREDSMVKLRMAAQLFPFKFSLCVRAPKRDGGGWQITEV